MATVKILLQDCHTHEFYHSDETWKVSAKTAHNFGSSAQALQFCAKYQGGRPVQIVLKFDDDRYDSTFPATDGCKEGQKTAPRQSRS